MRFPLEQPLKADECLTIYLASFMEDPFGEFLGIFVVKIDQISGEVLTA